VIAAHLEPKGLDQNAAPLGDFMRQGNDRDRAIQGSIRLRDAILRAQGRGSFAPPGKPIFKPREVVAAKPIRRRVHGLVKHRVIDPRIIQVQEIVARHFNITVTELMGPDKSYRVSRPRQVAIYVARKRLAVPYLDIAFHFGGKDHTTLIHAVREIETRIEERHHETVTALLAVQAVIGE
jgi:hypothetical protein